MKDEMLQRMQAMSDTTRFGILKMIAEGEFTAGQIAARFSSEMSRPAVSQHIRVLKDSCLIWERRDGTKRLYRLRKKAIYELYKFFESEFKD